MDWRDEKREGSGGRKRKRERREKLEKGWRKEIMKRMGEGKRKWK